MKKHWVCLNLVYWLIHIQITCLFSKKRALSVAFHRLLPTLLICLCYKGSHYVIHRLLINCCLSLIYVRKILFQGCTFSCPVWILISQLDLIPFIRIWLHWNYTHYIGKWHPRSNTSVFFIKLCFIIVRLVNSDLNSYEDFTDFASSGAFIGNCYCCK